MSNIRSRSVIALIFASSLAVPAVYPATAFANMGLEFLKEKGIRIGGWANGGATFNPGQTSGFNGTVTFADQANQPQLNQFNIFVQRPVVAEGSSWDFGARADFMFGSDAIFTQAYGVPSFDVNTGQPLQRSTWDLDICCASTQILWNCFPSGFCGGICACGERA